MATEPIEGVARERQELLDRVEALHPEFVHAFAELVEKNRVANVVRMGDKQDEASGQLVMGSVSERHNDVLVGVAVKKLSNGLRECLDFTGESRDAFQLQIKSFDHFVRSLPALFDTPEGAPPLCSVDMRDDRNGSRVSVEVRLGNTRAVPLREFVRGASIQTTPHHLQARETSYTTSVLCTVTVTVQSSIKREPVKVVVEDVCLGQLPVMVRSEELCALRSAVRRTFMAAGYEPTEPGGVFLVGSTPKVVYVTDNRRRDVPLLQRGDGDVGWECSVQSGQPGSASVGFQLRILTVPYGSNTAGLNGSSIEARTMCFGATPMPITLVLRALGLGTTRAINRVVLGRQQDLSVPEATALHLSLAVEEVFKAQPKTPARGGSANKAKKVRAKTKAEAVAAAAEAADTPMSATFDRYSRVLPANVDLKMALQYIRARDEDPDGDGGDAAFGLLPSDDDDDDDDDYEHAMNKSVRSFTAQQLGIFNARTLLSLEFIGRRCGEKWQTGGLASPVAAMKAAVSIISTSYLAHVSTQWDAVLGEYTHDAGAVPASTSLASVLEGAPEIAKLRNDYLDMLGNSTFGDIGLTPSVQRLFLRKATFTANMVSRIIRAEIHGSEPDSRDHLMFKHFMACGELFSRTLELTALRTMRTRVASAFGRMRFVEKRLSIDDVSYAARKPFAKAILDVCKGGKAEVQRIEMGVHDMFTVDYFAELRKSIGTGSFVHPFGKGKAPMKGLAVSKDPMGGFVHQLATVTYAGKAGQHGTGENRQIHPSSYGVICAVSTPDSDLGGLQHAVSTLTVITTPSSGVAAAMNALGVDLIRSLIPIVTVGRSRTTSRNWYTFVVNGDVLGYVPDGEAGAMEVYNILRQARSMGVIPFDAGVYITRIADPLYGVHNTAYDNHPVYEVALWTDGGRLSRPLAVLGATNAAGLPKAVPGWPKPVKGATFTVESIVTCEAVFTRRYLAMGFWLEWEHEMRKHVVRACLQRTEDVLDPSERVVKVCSNTVTGEVECRREHNHYVTRGMVPSVTDTPVAAVEELCVWAHMGTPLEHQVAMNIMNIIQDMLRQCGLGAMVDEVSVCKVLWTCSVGGAPVYTWRPVPSTRLMRLLRDTASALVQGVADIDVGMHNMLLEGVSVGAPAIEYMDVYGLETSMFDDGLDVDHKPGVTHSEIHNAATRCRNAVAPLRAMMQYARQLYSRNQRAQNPVTVKVNQSIACKPSTLTTAMSYRNPLSARSFLKGCISPIASLQSASVARELNRVWQSGLAKARNPVTGNAAVAEEMESLQMAVEDLIVSGAAERKDGMLPAEWGARDACDPGIQVIVGISQGANHGDDAMEVDGDLAAGFFCMVKYIPTRLELVRTELDADSFIWTEFVGTPTARTMSRFRRIAVNEHKRSEEDAAMERAIGMMNGVDISDHSGSDDNGSDGEGKAGSGEVGGDGDDKTDDGGEEEENGNEDESADDVDSDRGYDYDNGMGASDVDEDDDDNGGGGIGGEGFDEGLLVVESQAKRSAEDVGRTRAIEASGGRVVLVSRTRTRERERERGSGRRSEAVELLALTGKQVKKDKRRRVGEGSGNNDDDAEAYPSAGAGAGARDGDEDEDDDDDNVDHYVGKMSAKARVASRPKKRSLKQEVAPVQLDFSPVKLEPYYILGFIPVDDPMFPPTMDVEVSMSSTALEEISSKLHQLVQAPLPAGAPTLRFDGVVRKGQQVVEGHILVLYTKVTPTKTETKLTADGWRLFISGVALSYHAEYASDSGVVDRVTVNVARSCVDAGLATSSGGSSMVVEVVIRKRVQPSEGDKYSTAFGQKGVSGSNPQWYEMPWCMNTGARVQIMINPHGFISRMYPAAMYEQVLSTFVVDHGLEWVDATGSVQSARLGAMVEEAHRQGIGRTRLVCGRTGRVGDFQVSVGVFTLLLMKHLASFAAHAQNGGPVSIMTRDPLGGKARNGGMKVGMMECNALQQGGSASVLRDAMITACDPHEAFVCRGCGTKNYIRDGEKYMCITPECEWSGSWANAAMPFTLMALSNQNAGLGVNVSMETTLTHNAKDNSEKVAQVIDELLGNCC